MNAQLRMLDNNYDVDGVDKRIVLDEEIEQLKKRQASAITISLSLPDVTPLQDELKRIQARIDEIDQERTSLDHVQLSADEVNDAAKKYVKHMSMVDSGAPGLDELRRSMQSSLRRQLRKVEFGAEFLQHPLNTHNFFKDTRPKFHISDEPNYVLRLTFSSGKVRVVDATHLINARSAAKRESRRQVESY